jgi:hypothetical protein
MNFDKVISWADREKLLLEISPINQCIIAIDGEDGVGKTTYLAPFLKEKLGANVFNIDENLNKEMGGCLDHINYSQVKRDLNCIPKGPIIIEGVALLDVLNRIGVKPDFIIYACNRSWFNEWESYEDDKLTLEQIIDDVKRKILIVSSSCQLTEFRKEVYQYTFQFNPFKNADKIVLMNHK